MHDLAQIETANALWKAYALRGLITDEALAEALGDLFKLPFERARSDESTTLRAVEISKETRLSVYDSIYIALAEREKAELLTSDRKQFEQAQRYVPARII